MIYVGLSVAAYCLQNFANKAFGRRIAHRAPDSVTAALLQNGMAVLCCAVLLFCVGGGGVLPGMQMGLAAGFGLCYLLTVFLLLRAMTFGPLGGATLLCNIGMFISAGAGVVLFGDAFGLPIGLGMGCMLAAVILSMPRGTGASSGRRWFWYALGSGLMNGAVATLKRAAVQLGASPRGFLAWGFLFAALLVGVFLAIQPGRRAEVVQTVRGAPGLLLCGVLAGAGTAGGNLFQMMALTTVSSAIVYPFTAGFLVVALYLVSLCVYRETTLRVENVLTVLLCVAAILLAQL